MKGVTLTDTKTKGLTACVVQVRECSRDRGGGEKGGRGNEKECEGAERMRKGKKNMNSDGKGRKTDSKGGPSEEG